MQELRSMNMSAIVELLAVQTEKYSRMLNEGSSEEEFAKCSLAIRAIQSEIEMRRRASANTSSAIDPTVIFPE